MPVAMAWGSMRLTVSRHATSGLALLLDASSDLLASLPGGMTQGAQQDTVIKARGHAPSSCTYAVHAPCTLLPQWKEQQPAS